MEQEYMREMGRFICQKRKEKGLTQKELASRLGVTDKAVSKWERGNCCPDISLLIPLAKCLGVSTGELLGSDKERDKERDKEPDISPEGEEKAGDMESPKKAECAGAPAKGELIRQRILLALSVCGLLAILICFICDYATAGRLGWSYLVCCSVLFGWAILLPLLHSREKGCGKSLLLLSVLILPYLAGIRLILGEPLVLQVGVPVSVLSLLGIWSLYLVMEKLRNRIFLAWAIAFLIFGALGFFIDLTVAVILGESSWGMEEGVFHILITLVLAAFCAVAGYWRERGKGIK